MGNCEISNTYPICVRINNLYPDRHISLIIFVFTNYSNIFIVHDCSCAKTLRCWGIAYCSLDTGINLRPSSLHSFSNSSFLERVMDYTLTVFISIYGTEIITFC